MWAAALHDGLAQLDPRLALCFAVAHDGELVHADVDDVKQEDRPFACWKAAHLGCVVDNGHKQHRTLDVRAENKLAALVCCWLDDQRRVV